MMVMMMMMIMATTTVHLCCMRSMSVTEIRVEGRVISSFLNFDVPATEDHPRTWKQVSKTLRQQA